MSSLLVHTGQLSSTNTVSKRAADTGVLLLEFGLNKPTSERSVEAITRMNYLHSRWQKQIKADDMLFTLSLFCLEPIRWINQYEWRCFTDLELCATGVFWKGVGDAMQISYSNLKSYKEGWRDGLSWLEELKDWSEAYEQDHMVPSQTNRKLGDALFTSLLRDMWPVQRNVCQQIGLVLLGDRLRESMKYSKPPRHYSMLIEAALRTRKYALRWLSLPRPDCWRKRIIDEQIDSRNSRYHLSDYLAQPWYVKPTFWARWGPYSWFSRVMGFKVPGDDGNKYQPQGYCFAEIGPSALSGQGASEMKDIRERLLSNDLGGCPFG